MLFAIENYELVWMCDVNLYICVVKWFCWVL
jgi:hypothetical protein